MTAREHEQEEEESGHVQLAAWEKSMKRLVRQTMARHASLAQGRKRLREEGEEQKQREAALRRREEELARTCRKLEGEAALKQREEELSRAWRELEEEKASMKKAGVGPEDIIGLNFGGEKVIQVNRSLLLQFEDSMLARMFSGRHEEGLNRDARGNVFFDYSPSVMYPLVEILRARRDGLLDLTPPELPTAKDKLAWDLMVEFMMLPQSLKQPLFFPGIQKDLKVEEVKGWRMVLCESFAHETTSRDLELAKEFRGGSILLGARRKGSDTLILAAMGDYDVVVARHTEGNAVKEHNAAFWYHVPNLSIGFSPTATVDLDEDGYDEEVRFTESRASWCLTGRGGGYFAEEFSCDDAYEKVLMACPFRVPRA